MNVKVFFYCSDDSCEVGEDGDVMMMVMTVAVIMKTIRTVANRSYRERNLGDPNAEDKS